MTNIKQSYAYIVTSVLRKNIILLLAKGSLRQSEIASKLKQKQPNISKVLVDLQKSNLVECLTPGKKAWKLYDLTDFGKELVNEFFKK